MGKEIPDGESIDQFRKRVITGFEKCMQQSENLFLIVAHSGVYYILQEYLQLDGVRPKNCATLFHEYDAHANKWSFRE